MLLLANDMFTQQTIDLLTPALLSDKCRRQRICAETLAANRCIDFHKCCLSNDIVHTATISMLAPALLRTNAAVEKFAAKAESAVRKRRLKDFSKYEAVLFDVANTVQRATSIFMQ